MIVSLANHSDKKWHNRFFDMAVNVSTWSKDPDAQVGALLVSPDRTKVSWGYNGFARGIEDSIDRLQDKQLKNELTVHAELNCILNATETAGWFMYVTKPCCVQCASAIIQAGISVVVMPALDDTSNWFFRQKMALNLLNEADIIVIIKD